MAQLTQQQYQELRNRGLSEDAIKNIAKQKGFDLPSSGGVEGFSAGFVKGGLNLATGVARGAQEIGQRTLAAVTPYSLEEVRQDTGLESLDKRTPEGKSVIETLTPQGPTEKAGSLVFDIATFFTPASGGAKVAGKLTSKLGEKIAEAGVGLSAKEAPLVLTYKAKTPLVDRMVKLVTDKELKSPTTNATTILRNNLFGTKGMIGVQSKRASSKLWKTVISPALKNSKVEVNMPDFIGQMEQQIVKIPELTRQKQLLNALEAFKDDYAQVGKVSLEKLQEFKEGWATFIPEKAYKGQPIAGAFREIQNIAAGLARNTIYKAVDDPAVKAAYFDYGNLKNLQKMGEEAMTNKGLKGGAGTFVSEVMSRALTPLATTGGLTLYRVGKGLEFVGRAGLKTVKEIFGL